MLTVNPVVDFDPSKFILIISFFNNEAILAICFPGKKFGAKSRLKGNLVIFNGRRGNYLGFYLCFNNLIIMYLISDIYFMEALGEDFFYCYSILIRNYLSIELVTSSMSIILVGVLQ